MGLDAHVRCNCIKEGKTKPFPFPGRLRFEECGEPFLDDGNGKPSRDLAELLVFDQWADDPGCEHKGTLIRTRIGNISYIAHIRSWVESKEIQFGKRFPILLQRVVYSGSHAGDWIDHADAQRMLEELNNIETTAEDELQREFVQTMRQLCDASVTSSNPIMF